MRLIHGSDPTDVFYQGSHASHCQLTSHHIGSHHMTSHQSSAENVLRQKDKISYRRFFYLGLTSVFFVLSSGIALLVARRSNHFLKQKPLQIGSRINKLTALQWAIVAQRILVLYKRRQWYPYDATFLPIISQFRRFSTFQRFSCMDSKLFIGGSTAE